MTTALATCAAMGLRTSYIGTIGSDRNGGAMRDELDAARHRPQHAIVARRRAIRSP